MKTTTMNFIAVIIVMISYSQVNAKQPDNGKIAINPIVGDASFIEKFGYQPDASTDEDLRILTHLSYVENLLRQKDVSNLSPELQKKRNHNLDLLHDYWTRGKFPRNYDYDGQRNPCFIDQDETICAVGYLVEQTAGLKAAVEINEKYKYERVLAMNNTLVDEWVAQSGLTKEECATIQPTYGPPPCQGNKVWAYRYNCCVWEAKCISPNNAASWSANGHPCDSNSNNGNGNGNGGGPCHRMGNPEEVSNELFHSLYPNPASEALTVSFYMEAPGNASIKMFDMNGHLISTIVEGDFEEGSYEMEWELTKTKNGIYFVRMETGNNFWTEKVSIIR